MTTYFMRKNKPLAHIQNSAERHTSHIPFHLPGRQMGGREERRGLRKKKLLFLSAGTDPTSFPSSFHEISRDIIGNSNSINEHSQPVH